MNAFVLDTSIALKWVLEDETDRNYSLSVLQSITDQNRPIVPWLWYYELANALLMQVNRRRIGLVEVHQFLELVGKLPINIDAPDRLAILKLMDLAQEHRLTAYDAAFLELALRLRVPLASSDKELLRAMGKCGVELLRPPF